jgi:tRNA U34 5-methylaminomethyl-2-thiouridine-forming methyltransferase MnmC
MIRNWVTTDDGSPSLHVPALNQNYHSQHGALQESRHVFLGAGLALFEELPEVHILEVGFGTGINALLSHFEKSNKEQQIHYQSVEKYPLLEKEWQAIYWPTLFEKQEDYATFYRDLHLLPWNSWQSLGPQFKLCKTEIDLKFFQPKENFFELIYFDAFSPEAQPDLWTEAIFKKMFLALKKEGILVTYCAKGVVRRAMQAAGCEIAKIPGTPGKREMVRAKKP